MRLAFRLGGAALLGALLILTGGCAQTPTEPAPEAATAYWRGRLALRVEAQEPTSYYASFELSGQAHAGELRLYTPVGTTLARLHWTPQAAQLTSNGSIRAFGSLDDLATEATGTAIPIVALFQWLRGEPAAADGWRVDLSRLPEGRLLARRQDPAPAAELRLVLEQP